MTTDLSRYQETTIKDFGEQWSLFDDIDDHYYGNSILFDDIAKPFVQKQDIRDKRIADIGSGTGRIVRMLAQAGPERIFAIEPSAAFNVLKNKTKDIPFVECLQLDGASIPKSLDVDWIFSIGVIHHIPDADSVLSAAYSSLRPGGKMLVWLYGVEGNRLYLSVALPLRKLTHAIPNRILTYLCYSTVPLLRLYSWASRIFPMPMKSYFNNHISKLTNRQLMVTVFDQLNPAYAKYYTKNEAVSLFERAGFKDIGIHHRHGYSWTVIGTK